MNALLMDEKDSHLCSAVSTSKNSKEPFPMVFIESCYAGDQSIAITSNRGVRYCIRDGFLILKKAGCKREVKLFEKSGTQLLSFTLQSNDSATVINVEAGEYMLRIDDSTGMSMHSLQME